MKVIEFRKYERKSRQIYDYSSIELSSYTNDGQSFDIDFDLDSKKEFILRMNREEALYLISALNKAISDTQDKFNENKLKFSNKNDDK